MKDIFFSVILIAVGVIGLTNIDSIRHLYNQAYPLSAEKREALDRCAVGSSAFDRLDPAARDDCYARLRVPPPSIQPLGPPDEPRDDIRRLQATRH